VARVCIRNSGLLVRAATSPLSEVSVRHNDLIQAGPSPDSEVVSSGINVTLFPREQACPALPRPERKCTSYRGKFKMRPYRLPRWPSFRVGLRKAMRGAGVVSACFSSSLLQCVRRRHNWGPRSVRRRLFEAAALSGPPQTVPQDAAWRETAAPPLFGMETEPVAGGLRRNGARRGDIDVNNKCWRAARARSMSAVARNLLDIVAEGAGRSGRVVSA